MGNLPLGNLETTLQEPGLGDPSFFPSGHQIARPPQTDERSCCHFIMEPVIGLTKISSTHIPNVRRIRVISERNPAFVFFVIQPKLAAKQSPDFSFLSPHGLHPPQCLESMVPIPWCGSPTRGDKKPTPPQWDGNHQYLWEGCFWAALSVSTGTETWAIQHIHQLQCQKTRLQISPAGLRASVGSLHFSSSLAPPIFCSSFDMDTLDRRQVRTW